MGQQAESYLLLKAIIDKELSEIDEEMLTLDNSDISGVVAFHIEHGIRDVEQRIAEKGATELEFPFEIPDELKESINRSLLTVETLLHYYYWACYFGTREEIESYRQKIQEQLLSH